MMYRSIKGKMSLPLTEHARVRQQQRGFSGLSSRVLHFLSVGSVEGFSNGRISNVHFKAWMND